MFKSDKKDMKAFIVVIVIMVFLIIFSSQNEDRRENTNLTQKTTKQASNNYHNSQKQNWFSGGTLHKSTVRDWKNASYKNKLATCSDWLAATLWKGHLNSMRDFEKVKIKSQKLVGALNDLVNDSSVYDTIKDQSISEYAAAIITMANDLGP